MKQILFSVKKPRICVDDLVCKERKANRGLFARFTRLLYERKECLLVDKNDVEILAGHITRIDLRRISEYEDRAYFCTTFTEKVK